MANRLVASLRLKNERGERLSSHRSDHVTGVWGRIAQFVKCSKNSSSFGLSTSSTLLHFLCSSRFTSIRYFLCWSFYSTFVDVGGKV